MRVAGALVVLKGVAYMSAPWKLVSFSFDCGPLMYSMIYRQQFCVRKVRRTSIPHVWLLDPLNGQHNNHTNSCQIYKNTTINHRLEICKNNCTNPHCAVWKTTWSVSGELVLLSFDCWPFTCLMGQTMTVQIPTKSAKIPHQNWTLKL